jgi:hypothetical protein
MNQLIGKTLNGSLSYRMVEGKPNGAKTHSNTAGA